jgi:proteasome lid subunit RPN8/RPN11
MPVLGYKVAGAAPNFGEMAWGTVRDIRAAVVGTASEDGWVTHLGIRAGRNTASNASDKLGLYKATAGTIGARVAETAAFTISSPMVDQSGGTLYERAVPAGTKIEAGQQYAVANAVLSNSIGYAQGPTAYPMHFRNGTGTLPDPFAADAVETETQMGVYVVYTANRAPGAPTIIGPPSGAVTADPTPELRVGFVDADTGLGDAMTAWQFQVCDEAGTAVLHDSAKTSGTGGEAAWIPPALTPSTVYTIKAWTWDGHDTKSAVRSWKITVAGGGTLTFSGLSPDEGSFAGNAIYNTGSPRYATYHWAHDTGESTAWWYQRIVNPATGAVVRAEIGSALVDPDDTDRNVSWKSGWAPLPAGLTPYVWEVRVEDALGGETEWVRSDPFIINAGPNTPTGLSPAGGIITDYPVLASVHEDATDAASLLDVRHEVRPVGGVAVAVAASHAGGGTFTSATDATAFPAWGEYEWRAVVTDPWGLSATSSWHSLSYLEPPAITPVHPLAGETLTEPAPTVTWTLNRTQARYRVTVRERGGARVHYISWIVQSDAGRHTLPVPLPNATDYDLVLWAETADGATDEVIVPFRLDYASAAARSAEQQSLIATEGEARTADEYDEIVLDGVSIPIRSIQRTDTSRFEGKVTFGDYTVDSDQLMSTWAQSSWVGGMNVATQIEGATDSRFRWARAWTQSASQLTLPLATSRVDIAWSAPPAPTVATETGGNFGEGVGEAYQPWLTHARTARPLGARGGHVYAACGKALSAVNLVTRTPYLIGDLAAAPVNAGAWYGTGDADTLRLYLPLGEFGLQAYNPGTNEIEAANTAIAAVAVLAFDTRLYAVTTANDVLWLTPDGLWTEADPALHIPPDEAARHLVSYFDRSGNAAVVVVTNRQA